MTRDDVIARELGKLTGEVAEKAGRLFGFKLEGIDKASSWGAKLALQYLPTETRQQSVKVARPPEAALRACAEALAELGPPLEEREAESPFPCVSRIVHAGFLNLNPAIVHVEMIEASDAGCTFQITAAAKEGLIRQHTAEKAVNKVLQKLQAAFSAPA